MTEMCASPIVRRTCSPSSVRSRRTVGSSSSIRWRAGPILSRSPFEAGSMASTSDGRRELDRRERQGLLLRAQRVAGLGHRELRDRPDLAGLQLADRLLLLAVEQQQLADPLVLAARRVPDVGLGVQRPGQDAQVRQPPDERVGRGLEHAHQERPGLVGGDLHGRAALVGRLGRRLVGRGGEVAHDARRGVRAGRSPSSRCRPGRGPGCSP